jgi:hypothetical protein
VRHPGWLVLGGFLALRRCSMDGVQWCILIGVPAGSDHNGQGYSLRPAYLNSRAPTTSPWPCPVGSAELAGEKGTPSFAPRLACPKWMEYNKVKRRAPSRLPSSPLSSPRFGLPVTPLTAFAKLLLCHFSCRSFLIDCSRHCRLSYFFLLYFFASLYTSI